MGFGDNNDGFLTSHLRKLKCIVYDPNNLFQKYIGYSIYLMFLNSFFGNNKKKQTVHAYAYAYAYIFSGKFRLLNLVSDFVL